MPSALISVQLHVTVNLIVGIMVRQKIAANKRLRIEIELRLIKASMKRKYKLES